MIKKWLKERKQFVIAAVVFSLFGTGVTFALPYFPSDAELDPTCAPGDTDCHVEILPALTAGSVVFSNGTTLAQDNTNFFWDDSANQLAAKYLKADSTEYLNSSFVKTANQTASGNLSVFIGRGFGSGGAAQTATSTPSSGIFDYGGVVIGQNIMSTTTTATAFTGAIMIGSNILTTAQSDGSLNIALGTGVGGTSEQNQGIYIGGGVLGSSTATNGYNDSFGHQNVAIGRNALNRANQGRNTAVGTLALAKLLNGYRNTAIGKGAGNGGATSVGAALSATYTTFLGADTDFSLDNITNSTAVGYGVTLSQSNSVILGNNASVGIGDTTPDGLLDLDSSAATGINFGITNTGIYTGTGLVNIVANSATTGTIGLITANGLTSGKGLNINSSATAFTGNIANFALSGSNAANTGAVVQIDNTGTSSTNTAFLINHYATGTNNLALRVNDVSGDTTPFVIDGAGSVGIGTNTPLAQMHIDGANLGSYGQIFVNDSSGTSDVFVKTNASTANSNGIGFMNNGVNGWEIYRAGGTSDLRINDGSSDLMTFKSGSGGIGIGVTPSGTYPFEVLGQIMVTKPTGNNFVNINTGDNSESGIKILNNGTTSWELIKENASSDFGIWSGSGHVLAINQAGDVTIGNVDTTGSLFILDTKTGAGDPTGVNGGMYYNSSSNKFRCYENTAWTNCIGTGSSGAISGLTDAAGVNTIDNLNFAQTWNWSTLSTQNGLSLSANALSSGTLLNLTSTSTAAASNTQKLLNVSLSGANATSSQTTYGGYFSNTHTGTSAVNFGLYATASGGLLNAALGLDGDIWVDSTVFTISNHSGGGTNGSVDINSDSTSIGTNAVNWLVGGNLIDTTLTTVSNGYNVIIDPKTTGKVGIGTTAPGALLDVSDNTAALQSLSGMAGTVMVVGGADSTRSRLVIDSYGTNTSGTASILTFRTARGTSASPTANQTDDILGNIGVQGYGATTYQANSKAAMLIYASENWTDSAQGTYITLNTVPNGTAGVASERLRIGQDGNVSIGTGAAAAFRLDVATDAATFAAKIFNDGNATTRSGLLIQAGLDDHTVAGPSTLIEFRDGDGTTTGSITFATSFTAFNTTSDARLKENVTDSTLTIGDLMNVKIHDYTWIADSTHTLSRGVLAQELYQVYPLAVTKPIDESKS